VLLPMTLTFTPASPVPCLRPTLRHPVIAVWLFREPLHANASVSARTLILNLVFVFIFESELEFSLQPALIQ